MTRFEMVAKRIGESLKETAIEEYGDGTTVAQYLKWQWLKWDDLAEEFQSMFEEMTDVSVSVSEDGENDILCDGDIMTWNEFKKLVRCYTK